MRPGATTTRPSCTTTPGSRASLGARRTAARLPRRSSSPRKATPPLHRCRSRPRRDPSSSRFAPTACGSGIVIAGFVLLPARPRRAGRARAWISHWASSRSSVAAVYAVFATLRSRSHDRRHHPCAAGRRGRAASAPAARRERLHRSRAPVTPEVRIVDDDAPNAFAAGLRPTASYVGVTTGPPADRCRERELEAVLAHEISHIRNRDTYLMTMATIFAGVIALVADIGFRTLAYGGRNRRAGGIAVVLAIVGFVLAPYAALLPPPQPPRAVASSSPTPARPRSSAIPRRWRLALRRLELDTTTVRSPGRRRRISGWRARPIASSSNRGGVLEFTSWFNTHPPTRTRIAALEEAGGFRLPGAAPGGRAVLARARRLGALRRLRHNHEIQVQLLTTSGR